MITDALALNSVREPRYFKTASVAHRARQELCLTLTDLNNVEVNLGTKGTVQNDPCDACVDGVDNLNPGFPDGIEPKRDWPDVKLLLRASPGYGLPLTFEAEGTVLDFENGRVVFHLTEECTEWIGVFIAEVLLFRGDLLMRRWPLYLCVEPSLASTLGGNSRARRGGLTIPEIRLMLRDVNRDYSEVLDEVEFKDAEILMAMQQPVDHWNDLLPYEQSLVFDYQNFPFRYQWLRATCGYLLEMAAHWYRRNDLQLQAGGMTVNDRDKHQTYEPKAQQLIGEFSEWARQHKVSLSMRLAWGTTGSTWPGGNNRWA
jgi:hypothetical protein